MTQPTADTLPLSTNQEIRITQGSTVHLHFEVSLPSGEVIDSTFERPMPVSLTIGDDSLLAGFESVLINLKAGDTRTAHLPPEQAFGVWHDGNVQTFSHAQFTLCGTTPSVGMMMEFNDKGKNALVGVVSEITADTIKVDFNHPLAGQDVLFKVQIFKVIPKGQTAMTFKAG